MAMRPSHGAIATETFTQRQESFRMGDLVVYLAAFVAPFLFALLAWRTKRAYDARAGRRRWPLLIVGNACTFLFFLSLAFFIAENYYRFWYDQTETFAIARTTYRWGQRHYQLNNLGVRDNVDYFPTKQDQRQRIIFLGDSFTAGYGVPDVEDRFLNRLRRAHGNQWEVQFLGENGSDLGAHLLRAQKAVLMSYDADLFVLVHCPNDINDILPEWHAMHAHIHRHAKDRDFFVEHSYAANTFYFRWIAARDPAVTPYFDVVRDAYFGPAWERQQQRLASLAATCRTRGARFAVVLFPFLHDLDDPKSAEIQERMVLFWQSLGVPVLDLLPLLQAHKDETLVVNRYDAHPNERAHELAAEAIGKFLESVLNGP